jgi:hypothetical protein
VEQARNDADEKSMAIQCFLVCAESRYVQYLNLLHKFADIASPNNKLASGAHFNEVMPLPPWYFSPGNKAKK